jgi:hypothetical protein
MPVSVSGGPHGMHPTGTKWINVRKDYGKSSSCLGCHGADRRGSPLSHSFSDQTLTFSADGTPHSIPLFRGANVSCFLCHKREDNGALGGLFNGNVPPVVTNRTLVTEANTPSGLTLSSNEPGATLRIVNQPQHGSVALSGAVATYYPEANFAGADSFTYAAFDGFADSNLASVSVTVGNPATAATLDSDGDQWADLVEYALGLTVGYPNAPLAKNMAFHEYGGVSYWTTSIARAPAPRDAAVQVEFSPDLIHWAPGVNVTNTPFLLEVRDASPAAGQPKSFTRIRASRP